jgi:hypothetical protein
MVDSRIVTNNKTTIAAQLSRRTQLSRFPSHSHRATAQIDPCLASYHQDILLIHIFLRVYDDEEEPIKELKRQLLVAGDYISPRSFAYTSAQSCWDSMCARPPPNMRSRRSDDELIKSEPDFFVFRCINRPSLSTSPSLRSKQEIRAIIINGRLVFCREDVLLVVTG